MQAELTSEAVDGFDAPADDAPDTGGAPSPFWEFVLRGFFSVLSVVAAVNPTFDWSTEAQGQAEYRTGAGLPSSQVSGLTTLKAKSHRPAPAMR